jgi:hypothetical protein
LFDGSRVERRANETACGSPRHDYFIQLDGKFLRLTNKEPKARFKEIKRLQLAI